MSAPKAGKRGRRAGRPGGPPALVGSLDRACESRGDDPLHPANENATPETTPLPPAPVSPDTPAAEKIAEIAQETPEAPVPVSEHPLEPERPSADNSKALPPDPEPDASPEVVDAFFIAFRRRYYNDPVGLVRNVLKAEPTEDQEEFLTALARGERRISIRAGHGVGKSTACSWGMIWFMLTRFPQKTVCTAPTAGQLFDALFAELKRWIAALPPVLRGLFEVFSDRVVLLAAPERSFISARTSSADRPEALAGIHAEHVLLIVDEASAVPEPVFESASGSMSGHSAHTVLISNPTRTSGLFFRTHHELKGSWFTLHWSSLKNRLVSPDFIKQTAETYGEESNAYRVRVLGEFPTRDDDTLIAAELVDAAIVRDIAHDPKNTILYGLDCARFGDDRSVLCRRIGNVVLPLKVWRNLDTMALVGAVVNELAEDGIQARSDKPYEILVDSIGIGAGVADRLRELGFNCRDVNVSEATAMNPKAAKLRDELWLAVRDWLRARACKLPQDDDLRQELVSPTYSFTSNGKLKVEGKAEMKKRGLRSPDRADALCLTFASVASRVGGTGSHWVRGQPLKRNIKGVR
ncbi:terminase large subunit domain-containing protein [Enterovirga aerilata]|uniref:Terminase B n=1 Tax=Enterovirga aerilata TaxID=2730920 RepID=A0A849IBV6_9HYPH|nr:terminase family protein [Enterovirga sp. DB1703]NNM74761.1 hypothetical protein [Enterovirga sp. DB1703]